MRRHTGVGGDIAQHGRHVGADHARALADAGDADGLALHLHLGAKSLRHGVGSHDALGGRQPVVFLGSGKGCIQSGNDAISGQWLHDHAGGKGQHLGGIHTQALRQSVASAARTGQAIGAGAGIGISGIDQESSDGSARSQMALANLHRGRTKTVGGKYCPHAGTGIKQKHRQVFAANFTNSGFYHANAQAGDGEQLRRVGGG